MEYKRRTEEGLKNVHCLLIYVYPREGQVEDHSSSAFYASLASIIVPVKSRR